MLLDFDFRFDSYSRDHKNLSFRNRANGHLTICKSILIFFVDVGRERKGKRKRENIYMIMVFVKDYQRLKLSLFFL